MAPRILPRPEHTVSRKAIDPDALKVLYRLKNHGFVAYLVGGGVRDLLLGRSRKDFDIGTSAHPQQVKKLFRNCFVVGRRFRLGHVRFGKKVVEVSTFRRQAESEGGDTLIRRDNTFGTPEEDAFRRDFTVNALFYDIATFSVIDYVGGLDDLKRKTIRTIGDPAVRFREDPVRMLRAVAFAARLGFEIQRDTLEAIRTLRGELVKSSPARLLDEVFKILRQGVSAETFRLLHETGILIYLMPQASERIAAGPSELLRSLARLDAFRNTGGDAGADLTNPILLGHALWPARDGPRAGRPPPPGRRGCSGSRDRRRSGGDGCPRHGGRGRARAAPPSSMPIALPFARRDMDRLRLILAAQKRLADLRTSPRARSALAGRAYLKEALMWLEIHGGEAGRDLARLWQEPVASAPAPEEGEPPAPPPPHRRPRRRRRRTRVPGPPAEPGAWSRQALDARMRVFVTGSRASSAARSPICSRIGWPGPATGRSWTSPIATPSGGVVEEVRPDVVVNAAADVRVDAAENETLSVLAVNAAGARHLADAARAVGAVLVHISTDYVFDGDSTRPYLEEDAPRPLGAYGVSKLAGEQLVASSGCEWMTIRTSGLFGPGGNQTKGGSFVERILAGLGPGRRCGWSTTKSSRRRTLRTSLVPWSRSSGRGRGASST